MWCSFCLKAVIVSFFFREVSNVLYGELGVLSCQAIIPKGHLTHGGGDHLHIGDPRGLILYNMAGTHCSHCQFDYCFQLCGLQGHLDGGHRWWVPLQAGCYLLEAQGWDHHLPWFWQLGWRWISFCLQMLFCPLVLSSPCLRTLEVVPLIHQRSEGLVPWWWPAGRVQHFLPTRESVWGSLHLHSLLLRHLGCGGFFEVPSNEGCFLHGNLFGWNISGGGWGISRNGGLTFKEPLQ